MVKGISRQVIVVHSPDPKLFDQAIFILNEKAVGEGITDDALMKEANRLLREAKPEGKRKLLQFGPVWACGGAAVTGLAWLLSVLL